MVKLLDSGYTKSAFTNYKTLTIHGIITLNTLIVINEIRNHSSAPLSSIVNTISKESPVHRAAYES